MSASPTLSLPTANGPVIVPVEAASHPHAHRVVSVSPHVNVVPPNTVPPPLTTTEPRHAMATVRETIDSLGTLVDQGRDLMRKLSGLIAHAKEGETEAMKSVAQLQDRLRVSAQMLKAFQVQIGRVDQSLAEVTAQERRAEAAEVRLQQRIAEIDAHVDSAMQRLDAAVGAATEKVNRQWDQRAADAAARRPADADDRLPQARAELDRLAATIQDVAQHMAELARNSTAVPALRPLDSSAFTIETKPLSEPFIRTSPPMRVHSLACAAD